MARFLLLNTVVTFFLFLCPLTACSQQVEDSSTITEYHRESLKITTQDGRNLYFQMEIADTPQETAQGLMFRKEMAADQGMIFIFPDSRERSFWMKNTYLPLDILFLDAKGKIVSIRQGEPLSEEGISSDVPAQAAIELNQGTAQRIGIIPGDQVYFSRLNN